VADVLAARALGVGGVAGSLLTMWLRSVRKLAAGAAPAATPLSGRFMLLVLLGMLALLGALLRGLSSAATRATVDSVSCAARATLLLCCFAAAWWCACVTGTAVHGTASSMSREPEVSMATTQRQPPPQQLRAAPPSPRERTQPQIKAWPQHTAAASHATHLQPRPCGQHTCRSQHPSASSLMDDYAAISRVQKVQMAAARTAAADAVVVLRVGPS
jgi:hypothetical protein